MTIPTIVTTSTGGIAIAFDYSPYYERMATSLETISSTLDTISTSLETITSLGTTTGIRTSSPYEWTMGVELYDWYISQQNSLTTSSYTNTNFTSLVSAINSITSNLPKYK